MKTIRKQKSRILDLGLAAVAFVFIFLLQGAAINPTYGQQRRIEEEKRQDLEKTEQRTLKGEKRLVIDYGGWLDCRYDDYNNDDNNSEAKDDYNYDYSLDYRLWMKVAYRPTDEFPYQNEHIFYLRLKDLYIDRQPKDTAGGYDHDGPHLDYAYLILDFRPYWWQIGRQYFSIGRGISYSDVNDGAEFFFYQKNWNFRTFVSHTLPHEDNIDMSVPGYAKTSDRYFYGAELTYTGIPEQSLYGYTVVQRDYSNAEPEDPEHDYTYDSEYFGLGTEGKIMLSVRYWLELIKETGRSRVYETNEKKNVDAWAGDFGLTYDWKVKTHPSFSVEYAFGSGDSSRLSVTNTQDGNNSRCDSNFLYFGYIPAGYSLSPQLSNLHFYRAGVSFTPFEQQLLFKKLLLSVDFYRYYKDKAAGGIYDLEASENSKDVGSEIDFTLSWQIFSDVITYLQYGHFQPGHAYPSTTNDPEDYFSVSTIFTF